MVVRGDTVQRISERKPRAVFIYGWMIYCHVALLINISFCYKYLHVFKLYGYVIVSTFLEVLYDVDFKECKKSIFVR